MKLREKIEECLKDNTHCGYYHDKDGKCCNESCRNSGICSQDCPSWNVIASLEDLFRQKMKELIGEDDDELRDLDRKLYFVGRNELRSELLKKLESI